MKILMVCLGNICRSPLAEGILQHLIDQHRLPWQVDSAGTASYHVGNGPDPRSIEIAAEHEVDISKQRCRQLSNSDFYDFDLILAMDAENFNNINNSRPSDATADVRMILNYSSPRENRQVPDPYYGGGFDLVYDMLWTACQQVVKEHSDSYTV